MFTMAEYNNYRPQNPNVSHEDTQTRQAHNKAEKRNKLLALGVPLAVLGAVAAAAIGVKTTSAFSHEVSGTAISIYAHEDEISKREAAVAAHEIAHRYDNGCKIETIVDSRHASEMLPESMQDTTTVMMTLNLERSEAADAAMRQYADDDQVKWFNQMDLRAVSYDEDGNFDGSIKVGNQGQSALSINEQNSLFMQPDGSYNVRMALYLPGESSTDQKRPVKFSLETQSWYDDDISTTEINNVACEGTIVYKDDTWQLAK